jgi:hypothetical protein
MRRLVHGSFGGAVLAASIVLSLTVVLPAAGWLVQIDGAQSEHDEARALALDNRGYVFAGGGIEDGGDFWLVAKFAPGDGQELWRAKVSAGLPFPFGEQLNHLAVDAGGDAIAVGHMKGDDQDFAVVKLRGTDGHELWRTTLDEPAIASREMATRVATDANGDVFAAGTAGPGGTSSWLIAKFRGSDGAVVWTQSVAGSAVGFAFAYDLAVTATGDVVVVGGTTNIGTSYDVTAVKLAGSDGSVVWRADVDGSGTPASEYAERLALDAAGDVYVAGRLATAGYALARFAVVKISGGNGSVVWIRDLCCGTDPGAALALTLSDDGGVIVGGASRRQDLDLPFTVARFDAATGATDWRVVIPGSTGYGRANAVAVDKHGDVWAAGQIEVNGAGKTDAYVVKIHPCGFDEPCNELDHSYDAEVVFAKRRDGGSSAPDDDFDEYFTMAIGDQNAPLLVGVLYENHPEVGAEEPHTDFTVERISESGRDYGGPNPFIPACSDGADNDGDGLVDVAGDPGCDDGDDLFEQPGAPVAHMISGRRMLVKDRFGHAKVRKLALDSRDPVLFVPSPGGSSDPRLHGVVLELVSSTSGERSYAALPAAGWTGLGDPAGAEGYRYRDSKRAWGPCGAAKLRPGRLSASCRGRAIAFSLDEPNQTALAGRLHFAGGDLICTEFGGAIRNNQSTVTQGAGIFLAEDAPPPSACAAP